MAGERECAPGLANALHKLRDNVRSTFNAVRPRDHDASFPSPWFRSVAETAAKTRCGFRIHLPVQLPLRPGRRTATDASLAEAFGAPNTREAFPGTPN